MTAEAESETPKIRVVIVDDHVVVRSGLEQFLATTPDIELVGMAANGIEALERVAEQQPDVVLMDLSMPEMNGIDATREIAAALPIDAGARADLVLGSDANSRCPRGGSRWLPAQACGPRRHRRGHPGGVHGRFAARSQGGEIAAGVTTRRQPCGAATDRPRAGGAAARSRRAWPTSRSPAGSTSPNGR